VLSAERDVEVAQVQLRSLESHTRDVEMLYDRNRVPQNDMLAAQVALADARHEAIRADNRLDLARSAYNRLLHRELTAEVNLSHLAASNETIDIDDATAAAVARRPELLQASARARALEHLARSIRAADLPQAELLGAYTFEENRFQSPQGIASAGVVVSWNLADGGRTRHQAEALRHRAEAAWRSRADLESRIQLEVRQAWLDVSETRKRLDVTREAIRRADENLRVTRMRYGLGAATNTEVLDAETLRTTAYRNHHHAAYDAVLAQLRLRRAMGEL
jgi:outer membrane protein TolC